MSAVPTSVQWSKLNEYLLQVTTIHQPHDFCVAALDLLPKLVSYDQGIVYFLDETASVYDEYLVGVSEKAVRAYHLHVFDDEEEEADAEGGQWLAVARKLSEKVHHHLREEEKKFFQVTGKILSDTAKQQAARKYRRDYARMLEKLSA